MKRTLAVGFFDGVHLGHQRILAGADVAFTFREHPIAVLAPERAPHLIMTFDDRVAAIRACGVREVIALDFTREFASLDPAAFADRFLAGSAIRCGANWRFGRAGKGDATYLRALGYDVTVVPSVEYGARLISSTRIRQTLEAGEIAEATEMMGRPFATCGTRFVGKGAGRILGYPTVNLVLPNLKLALPRGVYAVSVDGVHGLANYGVAPTFGDRAWKESVLEIHFLDGLPPESETMRVVFHRFIRPERTFASLDALQTQIAADIEHANLQF